MDPVGDLNALGLELPNMAYIAGALIFGIFGWPPLSHVKRNLPPIPTAVTNSVSKPAGNRTPFGISSPICYSATSRKHE